MNKEETVSKIEMFIETTLVPFFNKTSKFVIYYCFCVTIIFYYFEWHLLLDFIRTYLK